MKYFLYSSIFALSLTIIGCGVNSQTVNNTNPSNSANVGNANSTNNAAQPKQAVPNELPVGKPIANGTAQTFKNVSFIVPKDWKKVKTDEPNFVVKFASSEAGDAITLTIGVSESVSEDKGPPQATTVEDYLKQLNPEQKPRILEINGTKGVLLSFGELTSWLTFPPRDNTGKTIISDVSIICPSGKIEQNKQLIADILYSVKFKN